MPRRAINSTDALAPLDAIVTMLLSVLALGILAFIPIVAFTDNATLFGYGEGEACVEVRREAIPSGSYHLEDDPMDPAFRKGASVNATELEVCNTAADARIQAAALVSNAAGAAFLVGVLWMIRSLLREARRTGLFTTMTARRTRRLGWTLILGSVLTELVRQVANHEVVTSVLQQNHPDAGSLIGYFDVPGIEIVVGIGLITLGRVLARAVVLQQEQDATI